MRIAYLLLIHECPALFRLLVSQLLKDEDAAVFVHLDRRSRAADFSVDSDRVTVLKKRIDVKWGGISMVDATLELLKAARPGNYDYYCLLSGRDYPLRSPLAFKRKLAELYPKALLDGGSVVEEWTERGLDRVRYYFLYRFKNRDLAIRQSRAARKWGKRLHIERAFFPGMVPCCGSQWWTISRPLADMILEYLAAHPSYRRFYAWCAMSDEQFFHTLLINLCPEQLVKLSQTLVQWDNGFPHVFSLADLDALRRDGEHYFFRKCSMDDSFLAYLKGLTDEDKYLVADPE